MKLNQLVVASMSVLGLISSSAFAATQTTTTTHHHNKKIHAVAHHHVVVTHEEVAPIAVQAAPVAIETEPKVDMNQAILDAMDHNSGRAKPMPDWFNRIGVSGGANADVKWGNRRQLYTTENVQRIALNDVYLNINGTVNDWAKAFASISFSNPSSNYSYVYQNISSTYNANTNSSLNLEQGFVTLGNLDVFPIFGQVGKQFQDYGRYVIHPLNRTLAQSLSETLRTSVNLGFVTHMGLHGSIAAFDNAVRQASQGHNKTVYTVSLGFDQPNDQLGFDVGVAYMSNMLGVNDVANFISSSYVHTVGSVAVYGDVNSGPFTLGARYSTALQSFSPTDLNTNAALPLGQGSGARPWAADLTAGYGFNWYSKNQNVYLGYQASNNTVRLMLPRGRILAGYGIDMWKNTNLGLEYTHDYAFSSGNGGTGNSSNTVGIRAAVKFG